MAIKFGEAEFGILKKQEGEPVKIPFPDVLPPWNPSPPRIFPEDQRVQFFGQIQPMVAQFNQTAGMWEAVVNLPANTEPSTPLQGENFIIGEDGLYQFKKGETQGKKSQASRSLLPKSSGVGRAKLSGRFFTSKFLTRTNEERLKKYLKSPSTISRNFSR